MKKILKNNNGQGVMEYMILTALIGIFCLTAVGNFGERIRTRLNQMATKIAKEVKI